MSFLHGLGHGLDEAFFMFWETLWALVLGFALSGAVQAFVSRAEMQAALGDHRPRSLARASVFGMVSSSCSYASAALAKTLFARGADLTAAWVFMVASTNLVVELGIVLWLLIGWQFALAEFVGGAIMIVLLALIVPRVIPSRWADEARVRLAADAGESQGAADQVPLRRRLRSGRGWQDAASYSISDITMLRKELLVGFAVAGFLAALVPTGFWRSIFLTGHGFPGVLENVVLGPFLALISFVCSVGNVPLAAALWSGGIATGGVVAFVFADLLTLPLLSIYRKYYGTPITLRLLGVFWVVMSIAGLAVDYLFRAVGIPDPARRSEVVHPGFAWDHTTILNIVAIVGFAVLYVAYRRRPADEDSPYAKDPVCGMQVEKAHAGATLVTGGVTHWFCCDGCRDHYASQAQAPARRPDEPARS
ncbi:MAG: permease [Mycobacteriales bacterium]